MDFLIINGEITRKIEANLTHLFWDEQVVLSQKIWFGFGGIPLFNKNIDFLCQQLNTLNIEIPEFLKNTRELMRISKRMLNKNKLYRSGLINIQLFIFNSKINYVITSSSFAEFEFSISKQGMLVDFAEIQKYSLDKHARYSFYNGKLWEIAKAQIRSSAYQNSIITNENEMICEGISSNIFMIKDNALITPSLNSGCFEDTIRNPILEIASNLQLKIVEISNIKKERIIEMNEVFFASEEYGIKWVLGIERKRFVHQITLQINEQINNYLKEKVESSSR
jgi:branched-subunit amino acid aminotransferase/4-amino-4-deoxychorismate lyase